MQVTGKSRLVSCDNKPKTGQILVWIKVGNNIKC